MTRTRRAERPQTHRIPVVKISAEPLRRQEVGVVYVMRARCDRCGRLNTHGAGVVLEDIPLYLGHRASHCGCPDGYELVDPHGLVQAFVRARLDSDDDPPPAA